MKKGFNYGQMFSYIASRYGKQSQIPQDLLNKIRAVVPMDLLETARFSGTMSNYMNLNQKGYGEHKDVWQQWQILTNRLNLLEKLKYLGYAISGNMKGLVNMLSKYVDKSFLYNFVNTVKQLGIKEVEFTFNVDSPFKGICNLSDSLESLRYIKTNTNLTHLELGNEGYLDKEIVGNDLGFQGTYNKIKSYTDYVYNIIPKIVAITGKDFPLGINIAPNTNDKFKGYNKAMVELGDKLTKEGYNIYLVPHLYFNSYDLKEIQKEIEAYIAPYKDKYKFRITEFNIESTVPYDGKISQKEFSVLMKNIIKIMEKLGIDAAFIHSLWTADGAHFSYIK